MSGFSRFSRFQVGLGGGVYKPRIVSPEPWADKLLASDPSLPRDAPYKRGLVCALMEHQHPGIQGFWNHYESAEDRDLWERGFAHAQSHIAHRGV